MKLKAHSTGQKLRGAYYTPVKLADAMVSMVMDSRVKSILEPSCGDGVFIDSIHQFCDSGAVPPTTAIEIDSSESEKVKHRYSGSTDTIVICQDFLNYYRNNHNKRFDLILGNPPYIRYQYLSEDQRNEQAEILASHGMKSNKLINAWVCFLVACVHMLSDNGTVAFVVPAEILQVVYAEDLRLYLSEQLQRITLITFEELVFPDIEQEVLIMIGERGGQEEGLRIIELSNIDDLDTLDLSMNGFQKLSHAHEKWTQYFTNSIEIDAIATIRNDERFAPLSSFGIVNVGITTGNNHYFSVTADTADKYSLDSVSLPLIGRSSHAHGLFFTEEDWEMNRSQGKRAMLVNFPNTPYEDYLAKHKEYIKLGEKNKEDSGYKCRIRDRWYIVPSVWVPDAFFLRRNNLYPKLVLNSCAAVSTDTMHRIKLRSGIERKSFLLSYYNSISFAFTEICGRSYGGGVLEILPKETGNIMLPKMNDVGLALIEKLLNKIDGLIRSNQSIDMILDIVDREILVEQLGIDKELCVDFRSIWKKLQRRRLKRSGE